MYNVCRRNTSECIFLCVIKKTILINCMLHARPYARDVFLPVMVDYFSSLPLFPSPLRGQSYTFSVLLLDQGAFDDLETKESNVRMETITYFQ